MTKHLAGAMVVFDRVKGGIRASIQSSSQSVSSVLGKGRLPFRLIHMPYYSEGLFIAFCLNDGEKCQSVPVSASRLA